MFEMLMLLGFAYAGFCHLFPEGKAVRLSFGKKRPAAEGAKRRRKWKPGRGDTRRWQEKWPLSGSPVASWPPRIWRGCCLFRG
jgi:hypothetical protein